MSLQTEHDPKNEAHVCFVPGRDFAAFTRACEWSTRVLPPPIAHGADDRAEVATLGSEDVLGPRGAHRIEAPLDDAILLKRPETLR
jgi:hypothetical protein